MLDSDDEDDDDDSKDDTDQILTASPNPLSPSTRASLSLGPRFNIIADRLATLGQHLRQLHLSRLMNRLKEGSTVVLPGLWPITRRSLFDLSHTRIVDRYRLATRLFLAKTKSAPQRGRAIASTTRTAITAVRSRATVPRSLP